MPYDTIAQLPEAVRAHLPKAAQAIYRAVFNHAWQEYANHPEREALAHKVAWAAVKKQYVKHGEHWVKK